MPRLFHAVLAGLLLATHANAAELVPAGTASEPEAPTIAEASDDGQQAIANIKAPDSISISLAAAEPLLANPVAFAFDNQGRLFVCETFRQKRGVEDNRFHGHWLDDDLAAQTVEDRQAYIEKHLGEKAVEYTQADDRIRLLTDTDGDGTFDKAEVFAEHFNQIVDGTGAGVLPFRGNVYYTNIPHLWMLQDTDNDGRADQRKALHSGYGVRFAFRGHDMHGLTVGHDGKIYFSIGDRGLNVKTEDRHYVNPNNGAVLRCNPDGSDLEMIHTGLRNPQELAFDDYGNLFTGDNNSDSGDKARWVLIAEGADSGWRMEYQYLDDRGPWNREKLWHPQHEGQAAYIVPPVANIGDGPSGLTYYPGTGMDEDMRGRFLMADFRGTPSQSGIRSFRSKPKGAFFELVDAEQPFWQILATDVDFGPDGALYMTDWVDGWDGIGKGRVYRFEHDEASKSEVVKEVRSLLASGLKEHSVDEVAKLLGHADRRIRLMAQFELVDRGEVKALIATAKNTERSLLARLHGVWGLGQLTPGILARNAPEHVELVISLGQLSKDQQPEIRARVAEIVGNNEGELRRDMLKDESPRVRYFAAQAIGKSGKVDDIDQLLTMLAENADADPMLRHGGIMGLAGIGNADALLARADHPSRSARLALVVALRKLKSEHLTQFLADSDPLVVLEAARAIHDLPIASGLPALAAMIDLPLTDDALVRRVLNANFRLGEAKHAVALAKYAAGETHPEAMRLEAIGMLGNWQQPSPKDRVLNFWRPLDSRDANVAKAALAEVVPQLITADGKVRDEGLSLAAKLGISAAVPALHDMALDLDREAQSRAAALNAFVSLKKGNAKQLAHELVKDNTTAVRSAARSALATLAPDEIHEELKRVIYEGETSERQAALSALAGMKHASADEILAAAVAALSADRLPLEVTLDVLSAAEKRSSDQLKSAIDNYYKSLPADDPLAKHTPSLHGGNAARGENIFRYKTEVSCLRCHKIGDDGGEVGPDLSKIAKEKDRRYLLESMVDPNAKIAKNFETAVIADEDGKIHTGIVREENDETVTLITAENKLITIDQEAIIARKPGKSAMPEDLVKQLTAHELRDLVEFLSELK